MRHLHDTCCNQHAGAVRFALSVRLSATALLVLALLGASFAAHGGDLDQVVAFDIKAQTLDEALLTFGAQAHVQISMKMTANLRQLRTRTLEGDYTRRDALTRLLRGTSLSFVEKGNTIAIVGDTVAAGDRPAETAGGDPPPLSQPEPNGGNSGAAVPKKTESPAAQMPPELEQVVVTGTHIQGAPLSSPVITITRADIDRSGYTTVGDLIASIPDDFANSGPQTIIGSTPNSTGSPSAGSAPNLHGLGAESTLTLVDGQRLAVDSTTGSVDISLIPVPVIDHIDVLTGGASAIYGADAVAGVVNITLKKDFDGSRTTILGGGTTDGGGTNRDVNEMLGKTWTTGGSIFDYEFDEQDPILASQRPYTRSAISLTTPLPGTSRSSFFANVHQKVGDISAFAEGLYTYRIVRDAFSNGPFYPSESNDIGVHEYAATAGFNASLPARWLISVVGDFSEQRTLSSTALIPAGGIVIPTDLYEGKTKSVDATANGPVTELPSGRVRGAVGAGYRVEGYDEELGGQSQSPGARRTVRYAYGELDVPLLRASSTAWRRELVLNASGRFERYSDFGRESVPKLGLVYVPFEPIKVRGTWGKAFRAPSLYEIYNLRGLGYLPLPDSLSPTGMSNALVTLGGNQLLRPETAKTWTLGLDYEPERPQGLQASITYFDIAYQQRISELQDFVTALIDPLAAPFVTRAPAADSVTELIDSASYVENLTGGPLDPNNVAAIVNDSYVNISSEDIIGVDFSAKYRDDFAFGELEPFFNGALLDLRQKLVPGAREAEISGLVFEPPKVRARGGVSLSRGQWSITGLLNYTGTEINTYQPELPRVSSWTTVDFNAIYRAKESSALYGLQVGLAVQNAFNRSPPFVQYDQLVPGIDYDPLNANVFGRMIQVSVSWLFQ
jgi:iron complex outermembrane recepter protein